MIKKKKIIEKIKEGIKGISCRKRILLEKKLNRKVYQKIIKEKWDKFAAEEKINYIFNFFNDEIKAAKEYYYQEIRKVLKEEAKRIPKELFKMTTVNYDKNDKAFFVKLEYLVIGILNFGHSNKTNQENIKGIIINQKGDLKMIGYRIAIIKENEKYCSKLLPCAEDIEDFNNQDILLNKENATILLKSLKNYIPHHDNKNKI